MARKDSTPPTNAKSATGTDSTRAAAVAATAGAVFGYDAGTDGHEGATVTPLPGATAPETETETETTSWVPLDLTDALEGGEPPPPTVLARTDGPRLLYAGKTHQFIGESESCKTWGAILAVLEILNGPEGLVLWIDYEDDAKTLVNRLLAMGVDRHAIASRLHYVQPEEPIRARDGRITQAGLDFAELLERHHYTLAVIDGVTEAMVTEGLDPLGTEDAAIWARRLPKHIAATGAAVVTLDHVPKGNGDGPRRYGLGSQHKVSGLTGASFVFEVRRTLHRATTDPVEAEVVIKVGKDRPGHVRATASGFEQVKPVAIMQLTAYPDGSVTGRLLPPDQATTTPPIRLLEAIAQELKVYPGSTQRKLEEQVGGSASNLREALRYMVEHGLITVEKVARSHLHTLTDKAVTELLEG
jgi:hypothetical protein